MSKHPTWHKKRHYRHFDWPVQSPDNICRLIRDPKKVAKWAFYPFIRFEIKTRKYKKPGESKTKIRPIMYSCHSDACVYSYYAEKISTRYEALLNRLDLSNSILAYRKIQGKCNIDFAKQAFLEISKRSSCCAIAIDIEKFFDSIDHNALKNEYTYVMGKDRLDDDHFNILKSITNYSFVERDATLRALKISKHNSRPIRMCTPHDFRKLIRGSGLIARNNNHYGIPQGAPLSGLFSNISLINFDVAMTAIAKKLSAAYFRYSDDILIVCNIADTKAFQEFADEHLKKVNLRTNEKTKIHTFSKINGDLTSDTPLQYLGFMFDGKNISIRSSSMIRHQAKVGARIANTLKSWEKNNFELVTAGKMPRVMFKKKLFSSNSHLGKRNFIRYALRASKILGSAVVRRQASRLGKYFDRKLESMTARA